MSPRTRCRRFRSRLPRGSRRRHSRSCRRLLTHRAPHRLNPRGCRRRILGRLRRHYRTETKVEIRVLYLNAFKGSGTYVNEVLVVSQNARDRDSVWVGVAIGHPEACGRKGYRRGHSSGPDFGPGEGAPDASAARGRLCLAGFQDRPQAHAGAQEAPFLGARPSQSARHALGPSRIRSRCRD